MLQNVRINVTRPGSLEATQKVGKSTRAHRTFDGMDDDE
jgi:hypothetical protein